MTLVPLLLAFAMQTPPCADFNPVALAECRGDAEAKAAQDAPKGSAQQRLHWQRAADQYRSGVNATTDTKVKVKLLTRLTDLYDRQQLNELDQLEATLRELIPYAGQDLRPTFRLARLREDLGFIDDAEYLLLDVRRSRTDNVEPYRMLAQFYARRATAMQQLVVQNEKVTKAPPEPGKPDAEGYYHVGGDVPGPRRFGNATYPPDANAAGITGAVQMEISLDEQGIITDARVVRSVPLLDEAALKAVREWRYDPVMINGKPVPARMIVTVNFSLSR
jgi:TonB family protein